MGFLRIIALQALQITPCIVLHSQPSREPASLLPIAVLLAQAAIGLCWYKVTWYCPCDEFLHCLPLHHEFWSLYNDLSWIPERGLCFSIQWLPAKGCFYWNTSLPSSVIPWLQVFPCSCASFSLTSAHPGGTRCVNTLALSVLCTRVRFSLTAYQFIPVLYSLVRLLAPKETVQGFHWCCKALLQM